MTALVFVVTAAGLLLPALLTRLIFLAPTRFGAIYYYPSVVADYCHKRWHLPRGVVESVAFAVGIVLLAWGAGGWYRPCAAALVLLLLVLEIFWRWRERLMLNAVYTFADGRTARWLKRGRQGRMGQEVLPDPAVHPELLVTLHGPFVRRLPRYDLGDVPMGRCFQLDVLVANHTRVAMQQPAKLSIEGSVHLSVDPEASTVQRLLSADVFVQSVKVVARHPGGSGFLRLRLEHGGRLVQFKVHYRSVFAAGQGGICEAEVVRYPGASQSAFVWRGDMDLYDTTTFQSIAGLERSLQLAHRYRFPQSLYLSSRLSLDAAAANDFFSHYKADRGQREIKQFVTWINAKCCLRHRLSYPCGKGKKYWLEIGNHMHLHYGTSAAAAPENQWTPDSGIGSGAFAWTKQPSASHQEQRDNASSCREAIRRYFRFTTKSWAKPDSTHDRFTAAAVEAAGHTVLCDADARPRDTVIFQPAPHHLAGARAAVGLTSRYPGDPQDLLHLAMFYYWLHRGHRLGRPVVYLAHQHLRFFQGRACTRLTEALLRRILKQFHGDFYINTVYGIGMYWHDVLSPKTKQLTVEVTGAGVRVCNKSPRAWHNVPIDLVARGGDKHFTALVSVAAKSCVTVTARGCVAEAVRP